MGIAVKKHMVCYCPFCGSDVVTHVGCDSFLCGLPDIEEEANLKINYQAPRCNRSFRVLYNTKDLIGGLGAGEFRKAIGRKVSEIRGDHDHGD